MKARIIPDQAVLAHLFSYDAETGRLIWKTRNECSRLWNRSFAGKVAGTESYPGGRRKVAVHGVTLPEHRVIWKLVTGREPPDVIDHVNGNPADNRIENLREATSAENAHNRARRAGQPFPKGVCFHKAAGKFAASIMANGKRKHLGLFPTPEAAAAAYRAEATQAHGQFARTA